MFERPDSGNRALLVHVDVRQLADGSDVEADRAEFVELARSAGLVVVELITLSRQRPTARHFIGTGKIEEIKATIRAAGEGIGGADGRQGGPESGSAGSPGGPGDDGTVADDAADGADTPAPQAGEDGFDEFGAPLGVDVVLFGQRLTPSQERNLEAEFKVRVLDRNSLILDIFAQRARTFEGKLQVELAQLSHLSTRLVRGWTHLERQKGGIGLRGPGETQLETDRRLLNERVRVLKQRLAKVRRQREQGRSQRGRSGIPTVALVGYTNAGKSSLFNRLTDASIYAADKLFATLDPTLRRAMLSGGTAVVFADTVGFIRDLPHELVDAFRSTLTETLEADLLLHVVDDSDEERERRRDDVDKVLAGIGADEVPQLMVFNKIDLSGHDPLIERSEDDVPIAARVSALTGAGIEELAAAIAVRVQGRRVTGWLRVAPEDGRLRARLFELDAVREERRDDDGASQLHVEIDAGEYARVSRELRIDEALMPAPVSHVDATGDRSI